MRVFASRAWTLEVAANATFEQVDWNAYGTCSRNADED
ncbi:hypothetical protein HDF16_005996 [Granulicella aggregans]|uniref:Uncharacterized protein n=1 Tax=Granulicella aggregans TaxID=474949 RepID=A0A7W7ZJV3_9BACT|nr:hypothetical protein [Granulicella aggregans]